MHIAVSEIPTCWSKKAFPCLSGDVKIIKAGLRLGSAFFYFFKW